MRGHFITFEGGEGAGKTSILPSLASNLEVMGYDVLTTREPGGIDIAEKIRNIILDTAHTKMDARTEALLYAAARRQHLVEKVLPALEQGKVVLCDRFIDSSLAYQGYARGLGIDEVMAVNQFAIQECMPNLTVLFKVNPEVGMRRISSNEKREKNRLDLEKLSFHEKVYHAYNMLAERYPERIQRINADSPKEQVEEAALQVITAYMQKNIKEGEK